MTNQPKSAEQGYIHSRAEAIPLATRELFEDRQKRIIYEYFKSEYSGEPTGKAMPTIERNRDNGSMLFEDRVFAGITTTGSHLVHIRRAYGQFKDGIAEEQRYFAVTINVNSGEAKEWLVDTIKLNEPHEPRAVTYSLHEDTANEPQTMQFSYKDSRAYMSFNGEPTFVFQSTFEIEHDLWILNHVSQQAHLTADQLGQAA